MRDVTTDDLVDLRRELLQTVRDGHAGLSKQIEQLDARLTTRLDRMNGSIGEAHGRLSHHDGLIETMRSDMVIRAKSWHERMNQVGKEWGEQAFALIERVTRVEQRAIGEGGATEEGRALRRGDVVFYGSLVVGGVTIGVGVMTWVLRLAGKL